MIDWAKYLKDRFQGKNLDKNGKPKRRSSKWRKVRKEFLKKNPRCAVCGSRKKLEIHHCIPFVVDSSLELDAENNLITLCDGGGKFGMKSCHFWAHFGDWKKFNPNIKEDALIWSNRFGWKSKNG